MKLDNWFTTLGMAKVYSDTISIESKDTKVDYVSINKIIKTKVEDTFKMLYLNKNLDKYRLLNAEDFLEIPNVNKSITKHKQEVSIHIQEVNLHTSINVISVKENNTITYFFGIIEK